MEKLIIEGGTPLKGAVKVNGAKNAALPIMAACLLVKGDICLKNIPRISDVVVMMDILKHLGADVDFNKEGSLIVNTDKVSSTKAPYELVKKMNASFDITGPLLSRFHQAEIPLPGGCVIGTRAVNLHLDGFKALGAKVELNHGVLKTRTKKLKGNRICFSRSSVGATKNVMMAACLAEGVSIIENAACEPEVVDLANFLNSTGAEIKGAGTKIIKITGRSCLNGATYEIVADRIEAGTLLFSAAITGGEIIVNNINPRIIEAVLSALESTGQKIDRGSDYVKISPARPIKSIDITTEPYPGFPTDLHPPIAAVLTLAEGVSLVEENIFDGRFNYVDELRRMGADITVKNRTACIKGVKNLTGAPVEATDIRAGAALVIAALAADGFSEINGLEYIDRGYESIEKKLASLGAKINRV